MSTPGARPHRGQNKVRKRYYKCRTCKAPLPEVSSYYRDCLECAALVMRISDLIGRDGRSSMLTRAALGEDWERHLDRLTARAAHKLPLFEPDTCDRSAQE